MGQVQSHRWCGYCGRYTLHQRRGLGNTAGCLLSVLTLGLFIPVWLLIGVWEALFSKYVCQACGKSRRT